MSPDPSPGKQGSGPSLAAFFITAALLCLVHFKISPPMLLLERFIPGAGLVEIAGLSLYAAWITRKFLQTQTTAGLRLRIWLFFSGVFFAQFGLGLAGIERCLMTGKLHLPIPALILAGPIYRGSGYFMPILFVSTIMLVGAAWCSHLCYLGCWDNALARTSRQAENPRAWKLLRWGLAAAIVFGAWILRILGMSGTAAAAVALAYGLGGLLIMGFVSRKHGTMVHCTLYCPIGLLANGIGRFNPFRVRFRPACDGCGACRLACRYNALTQSDIKARRPGISCTLCGDCLTACSKNALGYYFLKLDPEAARRIFVILVVSLHAMFLGVARI